MTISISPKPFFSVRSYLKKNSIGFKLIKTWGPKKKKVNEPFPAFPPSSHTKLVKKCLQKNQRYTSFRLKYLMYLRQGSQRNKKKKKTAQRSDEVCPFFWWGGFIFIRSFICSFVGRPAGCLRTYLLLAGPAPCRRLQKQIMIGFVVFFFLSWHL